MNRKEYLMPDGKRVIFEYDHDGVGKITLESMDMLMGLFAEKPQGEWIPCSERQPIREGHYLCSFKKPKCIDNIYVGLAYWTGGRWYGYLAPEIKAWMPLPKPWKGADDE